MSLITFSPSDFETGWNTGFSRTAYKLLQPQNVAAASAGASFAKISTTYQASMTSDVVPMLGYDSLAVWANFALSTATSIDLQLRGAESQVGVFATLARRSIGGGVPSDAGDFDRFSVSGRYLIEYKGLISPFIHLRLKRNGGTTGISKVSIGFQLFGTTSRRS